MLFRSDEERKDIKDKLEQKRNEFIKWEQENVSNFFSTQEHKFKEILEANSTTNSNDQVKTPDNIETHNDNKDNIIKENKIENKVEKKIENNNDNKDEKKEELFSWH